MKKVVLVLVLLLVVMTGRSQAFEGVMRWSLKLDITDPTLKAQMEQMAKMMGSGATNGMMPTGITVKVKGPDALSSIEGGIMDKNDVLFLGDKGMGYTINHKQKTYIVVPKNDKDDTEQKTPKVTKTSETIKVLNYTCTKYVIETEGPDGKKATIDYWATTEIKDIDVKALAKQLNTKGQKVVYADVDGFPLKIETSMAQGHVVMEAIEFKKASLPASDFELPKGYTETKMPGGR